MSLLEKVTSGKQEQGFRLLVMGQHGIGKTTFASHSPRPLFADPNHNTRFVDVNRYHVGSWQELLQLAEEVLESDYKTFVVEELGTIESMMWEYICERDHKKNIEAYGYHKGYVAAVDEWRVLVQKLNAIVATGRNVILNGHTDVVTFKNPEAGDFDKYRLKIDKKSVGVLYEFVDAILFARHEERVVKHVSSDERYVATGKGVRIMLTEAGPTFDAKNRFDLPPKMPFDWASFESALKGTTPETVREEIVELLEGVEEEWAAKALKMAEKATDVRRLKTILNKAQDKLSETNGETNNE